jgi:hypothetical protein
MEKVVRNNSKENAGIACMDSANKVEPCPNIRIVQPVANGRRKSGGGHVGVVESYNEPYVYILEALTDGCESSLNQGVCTFCVRRSTYTKAGNALNNHDGWKGYFRPIINNK